MTVADEEKMGSAQTESRETGGGRGDFGMLGAEELKHHQAEVVKWDQAVQAGDPDAAQQLELAKLRQELFLNEHDNAGAFKFKRFGRETRELFEEQHDDQGNVERPKVLEFKEGELKLHPDHENRRMVFINMGELDRFNKEGGGHAAGDAALTETAHIIEQKVREALGEDGGSYEMFRFSGNEFAVSFDNIDDDKLNELMATIERQEPRVPGVGEPAPLVATRLDMADVVEMVNDVQKEIDPAYRIKDEDDANRELMEVLKKGANYDLDVSKFSARVDRVKDKLQRDGVAGTEAFYKNYMAKMFRDTKLSVVDEATGEVDVKKTLERFSELSDEESRELALESARNKLTQEAEIQDRKGAIINGRVKEIRLKQLAEAQKAERVEAPAVAEAAEVSAAEKKLARVPEKTVGQRVLDETEKAWKEAEAAGDEFRAEKAKLEYQIEVARRDAGTGLLERGVHYEDLEKSIEDGQETSTVFIDMGFLKYFDQRGGTDVGDNALKLAASLMEEAVGRAAVDAKVYRYGGDEFTVQVQGGEAEIAKYKKALAELKNEAGAVPTGARGTEDGYIPSELVFNYGTADHGVMEAAFEDMKEAGLIPEDDLTDPDRVNNIKAEILTTIADKGIEHEKAVDRFLLLIEGLRSEEYAAGGDRTTQVDQQITFSNKAIFAEAGGEEELRQWAKSEKSPDELKQDIQEWVEQRSLEKEQGDQEKRDKMNEIIEARGQIRFYQAEIRQLEEQNKELGEENQELQGRIGLYQKKMKDAESRLADIVEARSAIDEA